MIISGSPTAPPACGPTICNPDLGAAYDLDNDGTNDSVTNQVQLLFRLSNDAIRDDD